MATADALQTLGLARLPDAAPSRQRSLVVAIIVARILDPSTKLATARALDPDPLRSSLGDLRGLQKVQHDDLYCAMEWLLERQNVIENALAKRHFAEGGLLYDLTSTYFAVEVFVPAQVKKLRERFGLRQVVLVGDCGRITSVRLREDFTQEGLSWITELRATSIQKLAADRAWQSSLFDIANLVEITNPGHPDGRLLACFNLARRRWRQHAGTLYHGAARLMPDTWRSDSQAPRWTKVTNHSVSRSFQPSRTMLWERALFFSTLWKKHKRIPPIGSQTGCGSGMSLRIK